MAPSASFDLSKLKKQLPEALFSFGIGLINYWIANYDACISFSVVLRITKNKERDVLYRRILVQGANGF